MINIHSTIQNNFNKASTSYDFVATIQKQAALFLVEKVLESKIKRPKTILDLGTGTGYITEFLLKSFPNSAYLLNDIADKMLEVCKSKFVHYKNVAW